MTKQFRQVIEGIDLIQFTRMDQTHEQIACLCSLQCSVEQRVSAIQNGLFQRTFDDIMPRAGLCRVRDVRRLLSGGPRMFLVRNIGIITDLQGRRATSQQVGNDRAQDRTRSCGRVLAL